MARTAKADPNLLRRGPDDAHLRPSDEQLAQHQSELQRASEQIEQFGFPSVTAYRTAARKAGVDLDAAPTSTIDLDARRARSAAAVAQARVREDILGHQVEKNLRHLADQLHSIEHTGDLDDS